MNGIKKCSKQFTMQLKTLQFRNLLAVFCFVFLFGNLSAQDIHYSMFNRAPMNLSPALVGVFGGDIRVSANYRSQWTSVPVSYKTFTIGYEHKLYLPKIENGTIVLAGFFNNDKAGTLALGLDQIGFGASYIHNFSNRHFLSGGAQIARSVRKYDDRRITTDLQYFNDGTSTGEEFLDNRVRFYNFSGGLNYRFQNIDPESNKRTRFDLGGAIFQFNNPDKSFEPGKTRKLESRYSLYGIYSFALNSKTDLGLLATGQWQGPHQETVLGINGRRYMHTKKNNPFQLLYGVSYRVGDAIIPNLNFDYRNFSFGASYDINISKFDVATNNRGGFELSAIYTIGKIRPALEHEPCPIY